MLETIIDYVNREETTYAIMINGVWGSGKTYFIKNCVIPKVEKEIPIYITLNSVSTIEELKNTILDNAFCNEKVKALLADKRIKAGSIITREILKNNEDINNFAGIMNTINKLNKESKLQDKIKDVVVYLDDLERTNIDIKEVLGFINNLVEHENMKIVIIANEDEIKSDEVYKKIKEKTVGKTLYYKPDYDLIISSFISRYKKGTKIHTFLDRNKSTIKEVFISSESGNFRILKHAIEDYKYLFEEIKQVETNVDNEMYIKLLIFVLAVSLESKRTENFEILDNISDSEVYYKSVLEGISGRDREKQKVYEFNKKYFDSRSFYIDNFYKFALDYIKTSILDIDSMKNELNEISKIKKDNEVQKYMLLMNGYMDMPDKEFYECVKDTYTKISNGEIHYKYYSQIYIIFNMLENEQLLVEEFKEYKNVFKDGLERIDINNYIYLDEYQLNRYLIPPRVNAENEDIEEVGYINKKIIEINNKNINDHLYKTVKETFDMLSTDNIDIFIDKINNLSEAEVFYKCNIDELFERIIALSNKNIRQLKYKFFEVYKYKSEEIVELKKLISKIEEYNSNDENNSLMIKRKLLKDIKISIENGMKKI